MTALHEPTGFHNLAEDSTISFVDVSRTFTIVPKVPTIPYIINQMGVATHIKAQTDIIIDDIEGMHFIYFDQGVLTVVDNPTKDEITEIIIYKVLVSVIYWDATNKEAIYFANERHGSQMPSIVHRYIHVHFGTRFNGGSAIENIIANGDKSLDTSAQFGVAEGYAEDEDIKFTGNAVASTTGMPIFYRIGANGYTRRVYNTGFNVLTTGTGRLAYNFNNGGVWEVAEVNNADFTLVHIFLTNDINEQYISVMGQEQYTTAGNARAGAESEINSLVTDGLPFAEFVPIATVIYQTRDTFSNAVKAYVRTTDTGESHVDWRFSNLSPASVPSNHDLLSGLGNDTHFQYALSDAMSVGVIETPTLVEEVNGDLTFGATTATLFDNHTYSGRINKYNIVGATITPAEGVTSYIVVNFNASSPIYSVTTDVLLIDESDVTPVATCFRTGTETDYILWDNLSSGLANRLHARAVKLERFRRYSGLILSEKNTRELSLSAGISYHGVTIVQHDLVDSLTDTFCFYHKTAGSWVRDMTKTAYINNQYDDGNDLQTLTNNKYVNNWVYRTQTSATKMCVIVGNMFNQLSDALAETRPEEPNQVSSLGILVGRVTVKSGDDIATKLESAFDIDFVGSSGSGVVINNVITDTTAARTLTLSDGQKYIRFTNIGATNITIPLSSTENFEIGTEIEFEQTNTGIITIVGAVGVTLRSFGGAFNSAGQYGVFGIKKVALNEWVVTGLVV